MYRMYLITTFQIVQEYREVKNSLFLSNHSNGMVSDAVGSLTEFIYTHVIDIFFIIIYLL
jgi:hypothetical protein